MPYYSMMTPSIYTLPFILLTIFLCSSAASADNHKDFLKCLTKKHLSDIVYTPRNSSYSSILQFSIQNLRFTTDSTPKPLIIITPNNESRIPPIILCAKKTDMQIRIRGAGHDYEGLSYVSEDPFAMIDLINLSDVKVNVEEKTAWVEGGATLGKLYYRIAEKSPILGFPAGICPTVGVGGHISGGGYGTLLRKYGLAADQVIDARIVNVDGEILDRKSMGEDLFWAIRGGGGASYGVITGWKVQLVDVPEMVTVFTLDRTLQQNAIDLIDRWQYVAPKFDKDLFIRFHITRANATTTATFNSIFLGEIDKLVSVMQESFPELGLVKADCTEMSWIRSTLYFNELPIDTLEVLLNRTDPRVPYFKAKSDFVQNPISKSWLRGIWKKFDEPDARLSTLSFVPYGGRMDEIPSSAVPFPHRKGNLYHLQHLMRWQASEAQNTDKYIDWTRKLFDYMKGCVSKNPRAAYINFRDLDIGVNNNEGLTSYERASIWGIKYFKNNFDRLVAVKILVDPENFFRNEQSIPTLRKDTSIRFTLVNSLYALSVIIVVYFAVRKTVLK